MSAGNGRVAFRLILQGDGRYRFEWDKDGELYGFDNLSAEKGDEFFNGRKQRLGLKVKEGESNGKGRVAFYVQG